MYILKNQKGIKQLNYKLLWKENTIERVTKETKENIDKSLRKKSTSICTGWADEHKRIKVVDSWVHIFTNPMSLGD